MSRLAKLAAAKRHPLVVAILKEFPGATVQMVDDLSKAEIAAIVATGPKAGDYLDRLGKTDLATMDEAEWLGFIEAVVTSYRDEMAVTHAPFAVLRSSDDPMTGPIQECEVPY